MRQGYDRSMNFRVRNVDSSEKRLINEVVRLHKKVFDGFFLSTMTNSFLRTLYTSFCEHNKSVLMVAFDDERPRAFMAYSWDTSGVYAYMLKHHLVSFMWNSFIAVLKKPSTILKFFRAVNMPKESERDENYVKIFSLGVDPDCWGKGYGAMLLDELKHLVDHSEFEYITLETDADNNEAANKFYQKNGMRLSSVFTTPEGRRMNKYHYRKKSNESAVS